MCLHVTSIASDSYRSVIEMQYLSTTFAGLGAVEIVWHIELLVLKRAE